MGIGSVPDLSGWDVKTICLGCDTVVFGSGYGIFKRLSIVTTELCLRKDSSYPILAKSFREHLTFAAKLEIGGRRQETGDRRKEEERRSQKKSFYKYEMLPICSCALGGGFNPLAQLQIYLSGG